MIAYNSQFGLRALRCNLPCRLLPALVLLMITYNMQFGLRALRCNLSASAAQQLAAQRNPFGQDINYF